MEQFQEQKTDNQFFHQDENKKLGGFWGILYSFGVESFFEKIILLIALVVVFFSAFLSYLTLPPLSFPINKTISIVSGATPSDVSEILKNDNLIRSRTAFEFCARIVGGDKPILAGQYLFVEPVSVCTLAYRIARGISGIPPVRLTIPEGTPSKEIALIVEKKLPKIDKVAFLERARLQEGYLFPDTYFISESATADEIFEMMNKNFNKKIEPLKGKIEKTGHSILEIIIMASILEKEATTEEDKAIVSGILWNRISKGMPLQVDAPFMYLLGKKSSELTVTDLQMKSPYNTYRNKGLPPLPIGNPGLVAIRAAISPASTSYVYYLSDKNGGMHYAKTFEEHIANKTKYLR